MPPKKSETVVPLPSPGRADAEAWVEQYLGDLVVGSQGSARFLGGQRAADEALDRFDVVGYARRRNEAYPVARRGASGLSPYIRHGLLTLARVWESVEGGPADDVAKFRDELLWQEYARHLYARLGPSLAQPLRYQLPVEPAASASAQNDPGQHDPGWNEEMACIELTVGELEDDGWLVNQTRMWLASQWTVRDGRDWRDGEDYFFRHLLDGSRAANRLGWQWTTGVGSNRAYGFSRWQVERRAAGLCATCELGSACPIDTWPAEPDRVEVEPHPLLRHDPDPLATGGPEVPEAKRNPEAVWLTAESLGHEDPALAAHPDLPVVFVFDRPLLSRLRLSAKRLVFLVETLTELAQRRPVHCHVGDPVEVLKPIPVAATFAPVPGWRRRAEQIDPAVVYPWPWLERPSSGPVASFSAWSKHVEGPG